MRDLANSIAVRPAIAPAGPIADNTPVSSLIIDKNDFEGMMFALNLGQLVDADATFAVNVQHGDKADLSDASDVPEVYLTGSKASAGFRFDSDGQTRKIGYVGSKRYVRLTVTPSNNTGNAYISAVAILGFSRFSPAV